MTDLIWRIQCAYWFLRRLGLGWAHRVWYLSGIQLETERYNRDRYREPFPHPRDSVNDELECWEE